MLVVNKDAVTKKKELEKCVTTNSLQISGQYVNKKGDQIFVIPSSKARAKFKSKLTSDGIALDK